MPKPRLSSVAQLKMNEFLEAHTRQSEIGLAGRIYAQAGAKQGSLIDLLKELHVTDDTAAKFASAIASLIQNGEI